MSRFTAGKKSNASVQTIIPGAFAQAREVVNSNWDLLSRSPATRHIWNKGFMCGYRRNKNLQEILTQARVRPPTDPNATQTANAGNRCKNQSCRYCTRLDKSGKITSHFTKREYPAKVNVVDPNKENYIQSNSVVDVWCWFDLG